MFRPSILCLQHRKQVQQRCWDNTNYHICPNTTLWNYSNTGPFSVHTQMCFLYPFCINLYVPQSSFAAPWELKKKATGQHCALCQNSTSTLDILYKSDITAFSVVPGWQWDRGVYAIIPSKPFPQYSHRPTHTNTTGADSSPELISITTLPLKQ